MPTHKQRDREREKERERGVEKERAGERRKGGREEEGRQLVTGAAGAQSKCQNVITQQTNRNFSVPTHTLTAALIHTCTHSRTHSENGSESGHATSAKLGTKPEMPAHLVEPRTLEQAILLLLLLHSNCKALPHLPAPSFHSQHPLAALPPGWVGGGW